MMNGLQFEDYAPAVVSHPYRMDVACFIGFVARRARHHQWTAVPSTIQRWLRSQGWVEAPYAREAAQGDRPSLMDVPVPIDSWDIFDDLFAWEARPLAPAAAPFEPTFATYLGTALRSFFNQGGRKAYVISLGPPLPFLTQSLTLQSRQQQQRAQLHQLIPGYPQGITGSPLQPDTWHGVGHLWGLADVAFVCLPDLPDLVAVAGAPPALAVSGAPEGFVTCSQPRLSQEDRPTTLVAPPRTNAAGYADWATALGLVADLIIRDWLELQVVAAVPLPPVGQAIETFLPLLPATLNSRHQTRLGRTAATFVQLVYPWVSTDLSGRLPGQLENPEGVLVGVLARGALQQGAFRSVTRSPLVWVDGTWPSLERSQRQRSSVSSLVEQISLLGPTPDGLQVISDVTCDGRPSFRPASMNRLISLIVRAVRQSGQDHVFEPSGPALWGQVRERLNALMTGLWITGALRGESAEEAFQVRCDRTTMTQLDLDQGRVIATVQFAPAAPIEQITVALNLTTGSPVTLLPSLVLQEVV